MREGSLALFEPLLQKAVPRHFCNGWKALTLLSMIIGLAFAVLLRWVPEQHIQVQTSAITLTSGQGEATTGFRSRLKAFFQRIGASMTKLACSRVPAPAPSLTPIQIPTPAPTPAPIESVTAGSPGMQIQQSDSGGFDKGELAQPLSFDPKALPNRTTTGRLVAFQSGKNPWSIFGSTGDKHCFAWNAKKGVRAIIGIEEKEEVRAELEQYVSVHGVPLDGKDKVKGIALLSKHNLWVHIRGTVSSNPLDVMTSYSDIGDKLEKSKDVQPVSLDSEVLPSRAATGSKDIPTQSASLGSEVSLDRNKAGRPIPQKSLEPVISAVESYSTTKDSRSAQPNTTMTTRKKSHVGLDLEKGSAAEIDAGDLETGLAVERDAGLSTENVAPQSIPAPSSLSLEGNGRQANRRSPKDIQLRLRKGDKIKKVRAPRNVTARQILSAYAGPGCWELQLCAPEDDVIETLYPDTRICDLDVVEPIELSLVQDTLGIEEHGIGGINN